MMSSILQKTTKLEQKMAQNVVKFLQKNEDNLLTNKDNTIKISLGKSQEIIEIPIKAFLFLRSILLNMAEGKSLILLPTDNEITTQQAAEILGVSRPHVIKLIENGEIPFHKVGTHRRILLKDLILYQEKLKKNRRVNLDFIADEAQELKLGYE